MLLKAAYSFAILFFSVVVQSQNIIYSYTFDSDVEAWGTQSLTNSGYWSWTPSGTADQGTYWNNRPSIDGTDNGALVYDGDFIINNNQGDTTTTYSTAILSPRLDFSSYSQVFIKFNQYYRNYDSETSLEISSDSGNSWNSITLNDGVNRNVETSHKDYEIIDISEFAANEQIVYVRFLINGRYYFWILDDIYFYAEYPVVPTYPAYIGEYLTLHGYPYEVDNAGWPYISNEAIVNFVPGTPESVKEQLREEVGAVIKEVCVCNTLETWIFLDSLLEGAIGLSSTGLTTGADEQVSTSTSASEIDDIDFNKYVKAELTVGSSAIPDIEEILDALQPSKGTNPLKIAVIDTGVDILHEDLNDFLSLSQDIPFNEIDDDENCYPDNYVGWNFVDDNNNASDDHGHGTHVAGIVAKHTESLPKDQKIQIVPYKTHDSKGLASLFDVTCAMYQSIMDKVSVVNCSWGFYGKESVVLKTAILQAHKYNITVVAASGNDSIHLVDSQQYPACYKLPNLISVGSYNIEEENEIVVNSYFSNYSSKFVDVLAPGVDILSTVPQNDYDCKTGTSMAAPVVAGIAAKKYIMGYTNPIAVKNSILYDAQDHNHLTFEVLNGNVLLDKALSCQDINDASESKFSKTPSTQVFTKGKERNLQITDVSIEKLDKQITIGFQDNYQSVKAYIINTQGQILISRELKNIQEDAFVTIELDALSAGLYFLRINEKVYEFTVFY